jgi:uncharacterized protein (DUF433 family)
LSNQQIVAEHPDLEPDDVREALRYAAWLATEEVHPLRVAG